MHCIVAVDVHFLGWIERESTDVYSSAKYNLTSLCDKQYTYVCTYSRRADERQRCQPAVSTLSSICSLMLPELLRCSEYNGGANLGSSSRPGENLPAAPKVFVGHIGLNSYFTF
jgi:hypothetical protein